MLINPIPAVLFLYTRKLSLLGQRLNVMFRVALVCAMLGAGACWLARASFAQTTTIDLSLVKLVSARPLGGYRGGQQIIYQLTVTNGSVCKKTSTTSDPCATATNVSVKDVLPAGLTYAGATSNSYNATTGLWNVGSLAAGASATLQILAKINADAAGNITNYAQVQAAGQTDIDSTPGNNSQTEDDDSSVTITVIVPKASLAGNVYVDANDNGIRDAGETGIANVTLALTGTDDQGAAVSLTATTISGGTYSFSDLNPGTYKVTETQPAGYGDGKDSAGSAGGTLGNDVISNIQLAAGATATNYNFGEQTGLVDLKLVKTHSGNFSAGSSGVYSLTVSNLGNLGTSSLITVIDTLPAGMSFISGVGTGWTCGANGQSVVCTRAGGLAAQASTTFTISVNLASQMASSVTNTATVSVAEDTATANNTATDPTTIVPLPPPPPPATCVSDGGSVLLFPVYTSDPVNPVGQNTRISLTNTNQTRAIAVHLFFVDGTSCNVSDGFVCLTQNQTVSFLTSDFDPGTTGYFVAVAVDSTGCPTNFNYLIGQADVRFASGHAGMIAPETFQALYNGSLPGCDANSTTAVLSFDGTIYGQPANQLAVPVLPSLVDGNSPLLIMVRTGGNLALGALPVGPVFGIVYNDAENPFSFSINSSNCQLKQELTTSFPRTVPRLSQIIPSGRTGWLRIGPAGGYGVAGALFNVNTNPAVAATSFNGGMRLPRLRCGIDSYTIPIFPPSC